MDERNHYLFCIAITTCILHMGYYVAWTLHQTLQDSHIVKCMLVHSLHCVILNCLNIVITTIQYCSIFLGSWLHVIFSWNDWYHLLLHFMETNNSLVWSIGYRYRLTWITMMPSLHALFTFYTFPLLWVCAIDHLLICSFVSVWHLELM